MKSKDPTVAVMSPGDMGHAVGALLRRHGLKVITSLQGRSDRTRELAAKADLEVLPDHQTVVDQADILLSIMVPAQAEPFARQMAPILDQSSRQVVYVDCNAIAPETATRIGSLIEGTKSVFVDAGIIGPPPRQNSEMTRIYTSGEQAEQLAALNDFGLDIRVISDVIGQASAVKMCYAALTKGTTALMTGLSLVAERLGVSDVLHAEFELSQAAMLARMHRQVPSMIPKAHRWVGEMEEIAKTFDAAGVTPKVFQGAADIYKNVAKNKIAQATQEEWTTSDKMLDEVIEILARQREPRSKVE